jgi:hypothetical protein
MAIKNLEFSFGVRSENLQPEDIKDPEWQKSIVIPKENNRMNLEPRTPVGLSF